MADLDDPDVLLDPTAFLCHYTSADTAFGHILPSRRLRMSTYQSMRDPFENHEPYLWVPGGMKRVPGGEDRWRQVLNTFGRFRNKARLLSFTEGDTRTPWTLDDREAPFRCAWSRPRMWEQYAANHEGVCLVFDRELLLSEIRDAFGPGLWEGSVDYTIAGVAASDAAALDLNQFDDDPATVDRYARKHFRDFFFLKTEDWLTEFEDRIVLDPEHPAVDDEYGPYVPIGRALSGVFVGSRFKWWQMPSARRHTEEIGAQFYLMNWGFGRPYPGLVMG